MTSFSVFWELIGMEKDKPWKAIPVNGFHIQSNLPFTLRENKGQESEQTCSKIVW